MPDLHQRSDYSSWMNQGKKQLPEVAEQKLIQRLELWKKPDIDPDIESRLANYIKINM